MEKLRQLCRNLVRKYEDIILYVFFGALTTLVSFVTYFAAKALLGKTGMGESAAIAAANTVSWVLAVLFAFFTNRIWVFKSPTKGAAAFFKQMLSFFAARFFSFLVDMGIMLAGAWILEEIWSRPLLPFGTTPEFWVKIASNVVVLVLNYLLSKLVVFRKKKAGPQRES